MAIWDFFLNNHPTILIGLIALYNLICFKIEYFPSKPRYSEDLLNLYLEYQNYLRYERNTRKFLPNNKIKNTKF